MADSIPKSSQRPIRMNWTALLADLSEELRNWLFFNLFWGAFEKDMDVRNVSL